MTRRKLIVILASVVLLISLGSIARRFWPVASPPINPERFVALGQRLAEETVKVVGGRGRIVAVINERHQLNGNPLHDEFAGFQSGLKKVDSIRLVATEVVPVDPDEMGIGIGCSRAQLQDILQKFKDANAIVFFIGLPEWGMLQARGMVPQPSPAKIIVAMDGVIPTRAEYGGYFANGFLSVLIGGRPAPTSAAHPRTPRDWFDYYYQVYTSQNFEALPE